MIRFFHVTLELNAHSEEHNKKYDIDFHALNRFIERSPRWKYFQQHQKIQTKRRGLVELYKAFTRAEPSERAADCGGTASSKEYWFNRGMVFVVSDSTLLKTCYLISARPACVSAFDEGYERCYRDERRREEDVCLAEVNC